MHLYRSSSENIVDRSAGLSPESTESTIETQFQYLRSAYNLIIREKYNYQLQQRRRGEISQPKRYGLCKYFLLEY